MKKRSNYDKAIRNIMNWANRPEWSAELKAVLDKHLTPVCVRMGINQEDIGRELGNEEYLGMLFGIMFEDFLTRCLEPDNRNIVDDYLKRCGWRESVPGRRYLRELRDSILCLYEVVEVTPGEECTLRDLVRGGKTFRVHEHMGTLRMVKWDRIAARVLNYEGKHYFSGGILPFTQEASQELLKVLEQSHQRYNKELTRAVGKEIADQVTANDDTDLLILSSAAHVFTSLWLKHTLERVRAPLPEIHNRDGEILVFTDTHYTFPAGQTGEIAHRIDAAPEWERDAPDEFCWIWLSPVAAGAISQAGKGLETLQDEHRIIYGTLKLTPGTLLLNTNSMERTDRAKAALETLLHGLIGPALSKLQTPKQLLADTPISDQDDLDSGANTDIDPAVTAGIIHAMLDQHYRNCLDEPIPILGNKTPRECVTSKKDRVKVIDWLKLVENDELRRAARERQKPYDCSWMWDELNLRQ